MKTKLAWTLGSWVLVSLVLVGIWGTSIIYRTQVLGELQCYASISGVELAKTKTPSK